MNSDLGNNRFSHISSRRKILLFIESLAGGGAENVLTTLVENIDKNRFDVTVCTVVDTGVYRDRVRRCVNYCSIIEESNSLFGRLKYKLIYSILPPRLVYRLFVPKGYDVEIAFIEGYATRIISASTNKHSRKIAWVHTDLVNNHWTDIAYRSRFEESEAYAKFDDVVCVSESVLSSLSSINPSLHNLKVIYNPVDADSIFQRSREPITNSRFIDGSTKLVSVGRLVPQKGYDRLLPILKCLHDEGYSFVMNILGEGPERLYLERYLDDNHMDKYVSLLGFEQNPYPYLAASDIYISCSRAEGFGLTIVEAMLLGVPVISTSCAGPEEILCFGKYGLIVGDSDASISDAIKHLLKSEVSEATVDAAKKRAYEFSVSSFVIKVNEVLS